jgi:hypothetical protein
LYSALVLNLRGRPKILATAVRPTVSAMMNRPIILASSHRPISGEAKSRARSDSVVVPRAARRMMLLVAPSASTKLMVASKIRVGINNGIQIWT